MKKIILIFLNAFFLFTASAPAQIIVTCAGGGSSLGDGGPAVNAELNQPYWVNTDDSGNLYICDVHNARIRKVTNPAALGVGIITTIAGNGIAGNSGNHGLGTDAQIGGGQDIAIDRHGNVYIADGSEIKKITPADTITTIAGIGVQGYNGDNIPATTAELNQPMGIAVDSIGNVYIADRFNYRIRKVDTNGIITTIAGTGMGGYSPDGSRADTSKIVPRLIRINKAGTIYFEDSTPIRSINSAGIITTVAGNGIVGYGGDSGLAVNAEIDPSGIAIDSIGNLFIAEAQNSYIRKVDTNGVITTIAGKGFSGFYGDNGNPLLAELDNSASVAVDKNGNIYIGDAGNYRVRMITDQPVRVNTVAGNPQSMHIYPNPSMGVFSFLVSSNVNEQTLVSVTNMLGEQVSEFSAQTNKETRVMLAIPPGMYFLSTATGQKEYKEKMMIQ